MQCSSGECNVLSCDVDDPGTMIHLCSGEYDVLSGERNESGTVS